MASQEPDVEQLRAFLCESQKEAQSLSVVITDFLNFARPVQASIEETDLAELLQNPPVSSKPHVRPGAYVVRFEPSGPAYLNCDVTQ